jgi:GNAT superfamily N-acetyltransferase
MIVKEMYVNDFDATVICFQYYFDQAADAIDNFAEEYDENSIIRTIRSYASKNQQCWFNAYEGSRVVGFVAGSLVETPWNHKILTANIDFIFLLDTHRNMDNFRALMSKFEDWARLYNAKYITGGDIGIDFDRTRKLYEHFGFQPLLLMSKELVNE